MDIMNLHKTVQTMNPFHSHQQDHCIYPGEFVPLRNEQEVMDDLNHLQKNDIIQPQVNLTDLFDSVKVEIAIPGVTRDELMIHTHKNILSVCVVHNKKGSEEHGNVQLQEFNCICFDRHIPLPENSNTEFISAEYRSGILHLHIPKTKHPGRNLHNRIVVY